MADDFQDKLNSILSNPEIMKMISSMAGQVNSEPQSSNSDTGNDSSADFGNLANIASKISSEDDDRIRLLNALRPYMNESRSANMDTAIKILKLTKLTSLL